MTQANVDRWLSIKIGVLGGIIAVLIALQGMIQAFSVREIVGGVISMSQALLMITFFAVAYVAISRGAHADRTGQLVSGALAAFLTSLFLVALVWLGNVVSIGAMMVNATPQLYDLLTFKQGLVVGSIILLALGAVSGVAAAIIYALPAIPRRAIASALVGLIFLGVLQDLVTVTLSNIEVLDFLSRFLYVSNGLSLVGAITVLAVIGTISFWGSKRGSQIKERIKRLPPNSQRALRWSSITLGVVVLLLLPQILGLYLSEVLDNVGLYLLMGLGLNIVVGFAGLLDLGYVAFFAIGAYTVGFLTSPELGRAAIMDSWWLALPFGVLVAMLAGIVLGVPVLKMRGDYLAIVTLGFGEIIRLLALSDLLKPFFGGAQGTRLIAKPSIGPMQIINPPEFYYVILAGCLVAIFVATRVKNSRLGRAWMALREDEDVAQAMGIELVATKLLAFGMGAFFGGMSGAIFASKLGSIYPHSFNFLISINVLSLIIIGGMGSIPGVIVGAFALVGLPELLREFADFRYLLYGAVLVVMMLTRPEGLVPEARRAMELEEFREEAAEEQAQKTVA